MRLSALILGWSVVCCSLNGVFGAPSATSELTIVFDGASNPYSSISTETGTSPLLDVPYWAIFSATDSNKWYAPWLRQLNPSGDDGWIFEFDLYGNVLRKFDVADPIATHLPIAAAIGTGANSDVLYVLSKNTIQKISLSTFTQTSEADLSSGYSFTSITDTAAPGARVRYNSFTGALEMINPALSNQQVVRLDASTLAEGTIMDCGYEITAFVPADASHYYVLTPTSIHFVDSSCAFAAPISVPFGSNSDGSNTDGNDGSGSLDGAVDMALASDGSRLYVITSDNLLREFNFGTGEMTTIGGQSGVNSNSPGVGPSATFTTPRSLAISHDDKYVVMNLDQQGYAFFGDVITNNPTVSPTSSPSVSPTLAPTSSPSVSPTSAPSLSPTLAPTSSPSVSPTSSPSVSPTSNPSVSPTSSPSVSPTSAPSLSPTLSPTTSPTGSCYGRVLAMVDVTYKLWHDEQYGKAYEVLGYLVDEIDNKFGSVHLGISEVNARGFEDLVGINDSGASDKTTLTNIINTKKGEDNGKKIRDTAFTQIFAKNSYGADLADDSIPSYFLILSDFVPVGGNRDKKKILKAFAKMLKSLPNSRIKPRVICVQTWSVVEYSELFQELCEPRWIIGRGSLGGDPIDIAAQIHNFICPVESDENLRPVNPCAEADANRSRKACKKVQKNPIDGSDSQPLAKVCSWSKKRCTVRHAFEDLFQEDGSLTP